MLGVAGEIGRRALAWLVLRDVSTALMVGPAAGVLAAALASRLLADRLNSVSPTDPLAIALGAALLALVALLAGALPARQAALHRQ